MIYLYIFGMLSEPLSDTSTESFITDEWCCFQSLAGLRLLGDDARATQQLQEKYILHK